MNLVKAMHKHFLGAIAWPLLVCGLLAACASVIGPRQIELPLWRLQEGIDRRFPLNDRVLELFDVQLSRPQLALLPDSDRVALTMDASFAPAFFRQSWSGSMSLSGRLAVDATRNAIFMREARVDHLAIDGADAELQRQFAKVANVLIAEMTRDMPLYRFHPEQLRYVGVQFVPTRIDATARAVVVTVEPEK